MRGVVVAAFVVAAAPAAAQVKCDYGGTQAQMNTCAWQDYERADAALNATYGQAMARARQVGLDDALRAAQRLWIPYRDAACEAEAGFFEGGSMQPLIRAGCLQRLTEDRTRDLAIMANS